MTDSGTVKIYTDGACSGNPGPGGWGAVLIYGDHVRKINGGVDSTTNNQMELTAAIEALNALTRSCKVELYTDSKYVYEGITKWLENWKRKGRLTPGRNSVKNIDLWVRLEEASSRHTVNWQWVKGHADNPGNELADQLARDGIKSLTNSLDTA